MKKMHFFLKIARLFLNLSQKLFSICLVIMMFICFPVIQIMMEANNQKVAFSGKVLFIVCCIGYSAFVYKIFKKDGKNDKRQNKKPNKVSPDALDTIYGIISIIILLAISPILNIINESSSPSTKMVVILLGTLLLTFFIILFFTVKIKHQKGHPI